MVETHSYLNRGRGRTVQQDRTGQNRTGENAERTSERQEDRHTVGLFWTEMYIGEQAGGRNAQNKHINAVKANGLLWPKITPPFSSSPWQIYGEMRP